MYVNVHFCARVSNIIEEIYLSETIVIVPAVDILYTMS